ncbi:MULTISPECIES: hypothetical protein [unclassified Paenibacillus]|uniref:Fibronectin type-III domain-containing protein n=2 Tax=Paenibacillus vandeheii TaxID=3035917 RepID=A0ABT8JFN7_9BACL|nr:MULTISPECIES: hypothetical protein [unclassified Paenibacillus]KGP81355.1 hypothetical protein P363_0128075 [Paenibacillus sp. MAEPY1]KGP81991.1 hypothetical protein P364_0114330 [Paenibacillus sp. MAEPY2]MDN4603910.1 hypothetical protein [Paenibacillus vandeheii]
MFTLNKQMTQKVTIWALILMILCTTVYQPGKAAAATSIVFEGKTLSLRLNTSAAGYRYDLLVNGTVKKTIGDGVGDVENPNIYLEELINTIDPQLGIGVKYVVAEYYYYTGGSGSGNRSDRYKLSDLLGTTITAPKITQTPSTPTNTNVQITISYPIEASIKRYSVNNGVTYNNYTGPITVNDNTNIIAVAGSGDGTKAISNHTVSNIDRTPPKAPTISASSTKPTKNPVTITINYESSSDINEYRYNGGAWTRYQLALLISKNSIVEARATDAAGNISSITKYEITNIDTIPPEPADILISGDVSEGSLLVSLQPPADAAVVEYSFDNVNWNTYAGPFTIMNDGTIYARVKDAATNSTISSKTVDQFGYYAKLLQAEEAVTLAEESLNQSDVTSARAAVSVLKTGDQTGFNLRLDVVQQKIDDAIAEYSDLVNQAKTLVSQAEILETQEAVDQARDVTLKLKSEDQENLLERLQVVQSKIDSKEAYNQLLARVEQTVAKAEETLNQSTVDEAQVLIEQLNATDQAVFLKRLETVQARIDELEAYSQLLIRVEEEVSKAEKTLDQAVVHSAQALVEQLKSTDQAFFLSRLQAVQYTIDGNQAYDKLLNQVEDAVSKAEETLNRVDVSVAQDLVRQLNEEDRISYEQRLNEVLTLITAAEEYAQQLKAAIAAVEKAESTFNQDDLDQARDLVGELNEEDQTSLHDRLDQVQKQIDNEPTEPVETEEMTKAREAVEVAESSYRSSDLQVAITLVNALPDSTFKTELLTRIDSVQKFITYLENTESARKAVELAEETQNDGDVQSARLTVEKLEEGAYKDYLTTRLKVVEDLIQELNTLHAEIEEIKQLLNIADGSLKAGDLNKAKTKINALPASNVKNDFLFQMATIQVKMNLTTATNNATLAVTRAESAKTVELYGAALAQVNALPDSDAKTKLETRLEALKVKMDSAYEEEMVLWYATLLVERVESNKTMSDYKSASEAVSNLKNSSSKTALNKRLKVVEEYLTKSSLVVQRFEVKTKTKDSITLTWDKVYGATGYKLERLLDGVLEKTYSLSTQTTYKDSSLALNTSYTYRLTPRVNSTYGEGKELQASTAEVTLPTEPTLLVGEVDAEGILHVRGAGSDAYRLYYVLYNEKGVRIIRSLLKDNEEKTYGFTKAGTYTLKLEAYNQSERVSSYTNPVNIEVKPEMVEPPTPVNAKFEEVTVENGYVIFRASVSNTVDGKIEKLQFELHDADGKRLNYSVGKLAGDWIEYSYRRSIATTPAGTYTITVKGKRGSDYSEPVSHDITLQ